MKPFTLTLFILTTLLMQACSTTSDEVLEQDPLESHVVPEFSIHFPKKNYSVRTRNFVDEKRNGVVISSWTLAGTTDDNPFNYLLEFNEVPDELHASIYKDSSTLNSTFRRLLTQTAKEMKGKDFTFRPIQLQGHVGMEATCSVFNGDGRIKSRVFNVEKDFFILSGGGKHIDTNSVNRFLNSFELVK